MPAPTQQKGSGIADVGQAKTVVARAQGVVKAVNVNVNGNAGVAAAALKATVPAPTVIVKSQPK